VFTSEKMTRERERKETEGDGQLGREKKIQRERGRHLGRD
jgi:hypothetical protein